VKEIDIRDEEKMKKMMILLMITMMKMIIMKSLFIYMHKSVNKRQNIHYLQRGSSQQYSLDSSFSPYLHSISTLFHFPSLVSNRINHNRNLYCLHLSVLNQF